MGCSCWKPWSFPQCIIERTSLVAWLGNHSRSSHPSYGGGGKAGLEPHGMYCMPFCVRQLFVLEWETMWIWAQCTHMLSLCSGCWGWGPFTYKGNVISSFRGSETLKCRGGREGGGWVQQQVFFPRCQIHQIYFLLTKKNLLNILLTLEGIILSNLKVKMAI